MVDMLTSVREHDVYDASIPEARSVSSAQSASKTQTSCRTIPNRATSRPVDLIPTVQSQVIPRLHAALRNSLRAQRHPLTTHHAPPSGARAFESEVSAFANCLLASDQTGANDRIDALRVAGRSLESIYLNLLAPAACHLRDLWSEDYCGLADVTLALCGLQSVLRHYASDFYAEVQSRDSGMRALLIAPSDKRSDVGLPTFGLLLMADFFRREGWDAWVERDLSSGRFRGTIVGEWFDLVEVLATSDNQLDEISSGIRAIRRGSPNPSIGVIVCGQVFIDHPEFVRLVGADLMASDPLSSLSQAKTYITRQAQRKRLS